MKNQVSSFVKKTVWTAITLFILRCVCSFEEIKAAFSFYDLWGYAGEAIMVTTVLMIFYEKTLWRFDPFVKIPKLKKEYTGTLVSNYDGIERIATIQIRQSFLSIDVIMKTGESKSKAISASIDNILGEYQLIYTYLNTPNASVRDRSAIHYGTAMLCVDNPNTLDGTYYSDRKTSGDMKFESVCRNK